MKRLPFSLMVLTTVSLAATSFAEPAGLSPAALSPAAAQALDSDFATREQLPQSPVPEKDWYLEKWRGSWGPKANTFPAVQAPADCDPVLWKRERILVVAQHYIGLPYQHHHIPKWQPPAEWTSKLNGPESAGLDCSNFTSWVYNYGLGFRFTSDIKQQADGPDAPGRRLKKDEPMAKGDLLFILKNDRSVVSHVVLFVDEGHILDSHGAGVQIRPFKGWYKTHISHVRRLIE